MKTWIVGGLVLLCAGSASAQQHLFGAVVAARARYGTPMPPAQISDLLNRVAWDHRSDGWGLLAKPSGHNCPFARTDIACDILVHAPSATHWDVLADQEGAARPVFNNAGPIDLSRFVAPIDPGGTSPPPPVPPVLPPPPAGVTDVLTALHQASAQRSAEYADVVNRVNDLRGIVLTTHAATTQQLTRIEEKTSVLAKIGDFFKDRATIAAIATGVMSLIVAKQTGKDPTP